MKGTKQAHNIKINKLLCYTFKMMIKLAILILLWTSLRGVKSFRCDRRPFGSSSPSSAADGRFRLWILDTKDTYIPDQLYMVKLGAVDGSSIFSAFIISAEGDLQADPQNPRRLITKYPGMLRPHDTTISRFSERCHYSVEQTSGTSKNEVEVYWLAPPSGNGCVTLRAMVAENEEMWYEDGGPLTLRLCEDNRQPDDVSPRLNYDCQICDEAKYEVTFTGIWSRHTHPQNYPENDWVPKYSHLIGASHSDSFILWTPGGLATPGLRDLAEHANSSQFETEMLQKVGDGVRTIIKGKGHGYPNMAVPTYAFFRADKAHHLVSTVVSMHPSPDWFLGVTRFELCLEDNTWLKERELNLYPWDAGTDNGVSYESSNDETSPQDSISRVRMSSYDRNSPFYEIDMKDLHPFGKLQFRLVQTYHRECETKTDEETDNAVEPEPTVVAESDTGEPESSRYHTPDLTTGGHDSGGEQAFVNIDPDSSEECPLTEWEEWLPCSGKCINNKMEGYQTRVRYHLVDGIPVEKYDAHAHSTNYKEVPKKCKKKYTDFEFRECVEDCNENESEITPSRQQNNHDIIPGQPWRSKKTTIL